jgi:hypothetical protein
MVSCSGEEAAGLPEAPGDLRGAVRCRFAAYASISDRSGQESRDSYNPAREYPHRGLRRVFRCVRRTRSMHSRPLVPIGLALVVTAGCQSYFPNGYGHNGPYSSFPAGTYAPATTGQYPTPVGGQKNSASNQTGGQPSNNAKSVPDYRAPSDAPNDLGAPASGDEIDSIKRPRGKGGNPGGSVDDVSDDSDVSLSSIDDDKFVSPTPYRTASASSDDVEPRRLTARPRPSPYKKDPDGYRWLRGVVARDPKTKAWRITYSRNGVDSDPYGGSLTLVDDEALDTLIDDDVVIVEGTVDESVPDRFGKPSYRVQSMERLVPKES